MIKHLFSVKPENNLGSPSFIFSYMREPYTEMHTHDFWEISVVTSGTAEHRINGLKREIRQNTICLIRPDDCHATCAAGKCGLEHIVICVRDETFKEFLKVFDKDLYADFLKPIFIETESPQNTAKHILDTSYKLQTMDRTDSCYNRLLSLLFFDLLRNVIYKFSIGSVSEAVYPAPIKELIDTMHKPENIARTIEELCDQTHYSHSYINSQFQKYLGETPIRFFQNIKMNRARILLETTELGIMTVIEKIGMSNVEHFYAIFKKNYGVTPAKYRKNFQSYYNSSFDY